MNDMYVRIFDFKLIHSHPGADMLQRLKKSLNNQVHEQQQHNRTRHTNDKTANVLYNLTSSFS